MAAGVLLVVEDDDDAAVYLDEGGFDPSHVGGASQPHLAQQLLARDQLPA